MGVKFIPESQTWEVTVCKRHPITRVPKSIKRIGLKSEAEAKRVFYEVLVLLNKRLTEPLGTGSLYRNILPKFYKSLEDRDLTPKTIDNYKVCLEAHTQRLWGHRKVDSVTAEEIRQFIKVDLGHCSPSHQASMLKFVRAIFNYAAETGVIARSPVPHMHFRTGGKIKRVLTEQQIKILLEKAKDFDHEWYPIWVTALYTGMRNGELFALTWDKVDLENRKILVSASWNRLDGHKDLTKSGEDRIVEIAPTLLTVLKEQKLNSYGSLFVLPRIRAWEEGRQAEILRMFLCGINLPRIRFHDLRASWATVMLAKGTEPVKVMAVGGWKDIKTMMIYIRKAGIDTKGVTDNLNLHDPSTAAGKVIPFSSEK